MKKIKNQKESLLYKWRYLPVYFKLLWETNRVGTILISILIIVSGLLPVLSVEFLRQFVDSISKMINKNSTIYPLIFWLALLLLANFSGHLLSAINVYLIRNMNETLKQNMQEKLLDKVTCMPVKMFDNSLFYNKLQRANRGIDVNLTEMSSYIPILPTSLITGIGLLVYLGAVDLLFPILLVMGVIPLMIIDAKYGRKRWKNTKEQTEEERLQEYFQNLLTEKKPSSEIRLFGLNDVLIKKWYELYDKLSRERTIIAKKSFISGLIGQVYIPLTTFFVISLMFVRVVQGNYAVGYLLVFISTVSRFSMSMWQLFSAVARLNSDLLYLQDIFELLDTEDEDTTKFKAKKKISSFNVMKFNNVCFTYPYTKQPVLKNINLSIKQNESIAIVGDNGSGKTTLAKIILGLYKPTSGEITIDGVNINDISEKSLRKIAAAVFQNYVRYEASVTENIGFGHLSLMHDESEIKIASEKSDADSFINRLPQQYNTMLGKTLYDDSIDLSTGQWQKLAISRGYIRGADIMILDEPTASLDAKAETEVYSQFRNIAKGTLSVLISHRLGSARTADRIIVLHNGTIIEEGTHEELIENNGYYSQMYNVQAEWYRN